MIDTLGRNRIRSTVAALAATALAIVAAATVVAQAAGPPPVSIEDEGADCAFALPGSLTANAKLPDPFKRINGTRIASKSDWRCRREEVKRLA